MKHAKSWVLFKRCIYVNKRVKLLRYEFETKIFFLMTYYVQSEQCNE